MICPLCGNNLVFKCRSVMDSLKNVYYCDGCPMVYLLMRDHERSMIAEITNRVDRKGRHEWVKPGSTM